MPNDAIVNIPMVPTMNGYNEKQKPDYTVTTTELSGSTGSSKRPNLGRRTTTDGPDPTIHDDEITQFGKIYDKVISVSPIIRWAIYIVPIAALLAIPLILSATVYKNAEAAQIRLLGLFIWIEVVWISLWVAKLCAILFRLLFMFFGGLINSGFRKYAHLLKALEIPISLFFWAIMAFATHRFIYVYERHDKNVTKIDWIHELTKVLRANIATTAIYLFEKTLIQLIGINYNRGTLYQKVHRNKKIGHVLDLMYEASSKRYPAYSRADLKDLDISIHENTNIAGPRTRQFMSTLTRFGDGVASAFGNMASEITGKQVFQPTATHHIVNSALERRVGSEALGERLWRTFTLDSGTDALSEQDILEELGSDRSEDAKYIFGALDRDHNGDISLEEMIMFCSEVHQERKNMYKGFQDVKQALSVLDKVLMVVVLIVITLIYAAFFSSYLAKNYYYIWTTFTGLSFMLGTTTAELLGACILVFVKHPYDIGDRVSINGADLVVEKISLLYTLFRRVDTNGLVQIPNNTNNLIWIDNLSRSKAMKERITFSVSAATPFWDVEELRQEMEAFVQAPDNRRDYQPDIDIELISSGDLSKLDLRVELQHKSNWSNEQLRMYRRSKFNCALLSAMRKVAIEAAGATASPKSEAVPAGGPVAMSSGLELLPSLLSRRTPVQEFGIGK